MKNMTKLLLVTSAAVAITSQAGAAERVLSPRAKANQIITVPATGSDPDVIRGQNALGAAARSKTLGSRSMIAATSPNDPDLVRSQGPRAGSPRGLQQLRESGREFQVAPLK